MCKKVTLFCFALVSAMFLSTCMYAQERLWVTDIQGRLHSMNTDGTEVFTKSEFGNLDFGRDVGGFSVVKGVPNYTGHLVIATTSGSAYSEGALSMLGPDGLRRLYIHDYMESTSISGAVCTSSGIVMAKAHVIYSKWSGVRRLPYDGSESESYRKPNTDYSNEYQLTNVNDTIYGVSRGDANNTGFIYRILPTEYNGTAPLHVFDFMDSEQGIRPVGRLAFANGFLFGITQFGGDNNKGVFFKVRKDGSDYEKLFDRALTSLTKRELNGKYQTLLDVIAEGYIPVTDQNGNYIIHDEQGIYKVSASGDWIATISFLNANKIELVTPQFQHIVKVSNIANGTTGLPTQFTVQVPTFIGAQLYQLQVSNTADFSSGVQTLLNASEYFDLILSAGTTYYTRARTDLWSYYGEVVSFTTGSSLTENPLRFYVSEMAENFSVNRDGTDRHAFEEYTTRGILQLDNGDKVFLGEPDPARGDGDAALWKITPDGKQFLYQGFFGEEGISPEHMADGGDGYFYALKYYAAGDHLTGIVRFKIDGSAMEIYPVSTPSVLRSTYLTKTPQGVYGISRGGSTSKGFVFKINAEFGLQTLFTFANDATGVRPYAKLLVGRDGFLYGTARSGGANNAGVIFKINLAGDQYTVLHHFTQINGKNPETALVQDSNGTLFGSTTLGGKNSYGVLYKIEENGTGFQRLLEYFYTGGKNLAGSISVDDSFVYATAGQGLFKINKDGTGYSALNVSAISFQTFPSTASDIAITYPVDYETPVDVNSIITTTSIQGAKTYYLEVSLSPAFDSNVIKFENDSAHFAVGGLDYDKLYYARARTNVSPAYGEISIFRTGDEAFHVYLIDPANGTLDFGEVSDQNEIEGWMTINGVPEAQDYHLQISYFDDFDEWTIHQYYVHATSGDPQVFIESLSPDHQFYARVRTDLSSKWGPVTTFTTRDNSGSSKTALVDVYPNPSRNSFTLTSGTDQILEITIHDATGNLLFKNRELSNGVLQFGEELPKGLYLMTVKMKDKVETIRIAKE